MYLFKQVSDLKYYLNGLKSGNAAIGFVPTMGALHEGHLSLVRNARERTDYVVCSIFVNPTQFDDPKDLNKYPRTTSTDIEKLTKEGVDVLFLPPSSEIYPPDLDTRNLYDYGQMAKIMEGAYRPGHFDGMAQVVRRLIEIVEPDLIFMGQKDYQQQAIVKKMLHLMGSSTKLVRCPIIREADGLAMSSRNSRLGKSDRKKAALISKILFEAKTDSESLSLAETMARARAKLISNKLEADYLEIVDADSLERISEFSQAKSAVICTTVRIGGVRLLDNIILF